jgi:hypothetical protein
MYGFNQALHYPTIRGLYILVVGLRENLIKRTAHMWRPEPPSSSSETNLPDRDRSHGQPGNPCPHGVRGEPQPATGQTSLRPAGLD